MKSFAAFTLLLLSSLSFSQNKVQLRDVSFTVPAKFAYTLKENKEVDYDTFNENGKVLIDTVSNYLPSKILYQYYELPGMGYDPVEVTLKRLNDIMAEDFKIDTLIIDRKGNYSVSRFDAMGTTIYEIKSLGEIGWLNVQYTDPLNSDSANLKIAEGIAKSAKHSGEYGGEYQKHVQEGADASKTVIICIVLLVLIFLARRFIKKQKEQA